MEEFIRLEHVSFTYDDDKESIPALKDISLSIGEGEYVAVLGHNGSGKSTFAKLLNMILEPTEGKIFICGMETTSPDFKEDDMFEVRRRVGMVFQNPDNQLVATQVEEDVAFGPENLGVPREELIERVADALRDVGMTQFAKKSPHHLSGGQKQRVAIAGIIAMQPRCIVLDEATAMLDPQGRKEVLSTVEKLHREKGITVIHITHYMEEAVRANRVIVINDGTLYLDGTPKEVFSRVEELRNVGLEAPQGLELVYELQKAGCSIESAGVSEEECLAALRGLLSAKE